MLFFRGAIVNFGNVPVGTMATQKVRLCNAGSTEAAVTVVDPGLPFLLVHQQLSIRRYGPLAETCYFN